MILWLVNYRPHLRQARKSRAIRIFRFSSYSSFISCTPTYLEEPQGISHSLSSLLFPTDHGPLTCPDQPVPILSGRSRPCRDPVVATAHYCFKFFSCNTYGSPRKCCNQKTYGPTKPFRCNTYKKQDRKSTRLNSSH